MTYVWQSDLDTILGPPLRKAGLALIEERGWRTRGRSMSLPFNPRGLMIHHDGSARGDSPGVVNILEDGRPGLGGPLSQLWTCGGCNGLHPEGSCHLIAAGRASHAGYGDGWGRILRDRGNELALGLETDNTTGEPTSAAMQRGMRIVAAALCLARGWDPMLSLPAHKEYAPGRKPDPDDVAMGSFRLNVDHLVTLTREQRQPASLPRVDPDRIYNARQVDKGDRRTYPKGVRLVEASLVKARLLPRRWASDGSWGTATHQAWREWEARCGITHPNTYPNRLPLRKLAARYDLFRVAT